MLRSENKSKLLENDEFLRLYYKELGIRGRKINKGSATKVIRFLLERERASSAGVLNDDDFNAAAKRHFIGGPNNARTIIMVYKEVEKKYIERVMSSSASFYIGNGLDAKGQFSILSNQVDMVNNNSSFLEDNNARERKLENSCGSNFFETFNTTQLLGISDKKKRNKVAVKMEPTEEEISTRQAVIREKGDIDTENNEEPWECFNGVMNPFPEKTDIDGDDIWSIICENVAPKNYTPKKKAVMRKCVALSLLRNTNRSPLFLSKLAQQYNIPRSTLVKNYNKVVAELENIKKREANKPTTCYLRKPLDKGKSIMKIPLYPDKGGYSVLEIDIALQILFRDIQGNTLLDRPIEQMQELINHVIVEGDSLEYVANEYEIAFDHLRRICQMVINYLESNVKSVKTNQPVVVAESASRKSYSSFISVNPQVEDSVIRDSCDVHSQASSDLNNQKFIDNGNENGHHDNTNLEDVVMIENDVQIIEAEETVYSEEPMNTTTASSCSDSDDSEFFARRAARMRAQAAVLQVLQLCGYSKTDRLVVAICDVIIGDENVGIVAERYGFNIPYLKTYIKTTYLHMQSYPEIMKESWSAENNDDVNFLRKNYSN